MPVWPLPCFLAIQTHQSDSESESELSDSDLSLDAAVSAGGPGMSLSFLLLKLEGYTTCVVAASGFFARLGAGGGVM